MEDKDIPSTPVSNWQPITRPIDLAVLGKYGEELCEAGASAFRTVIQGIDEVEPVTHKPNRQWLEDEIADVMAMMHFMIIHFALNEFRIHQRKLHKINYKAPWFAALKAQEQTP
jgi:hypothetical protein